jgi:excisionase family DNA binding protein
MFAASNPTVPGSTEPDLLSVPEFCRVMGIGRTTAYELMAAQEIVPIRIGRRTLIPRSEKDALIANRLAAAKANA